MPHVYKCYWLYVLYLVDVVHCLPALRLRPSACRSRLRRCSTRPRMTLTCTSSTTCRTTSRRRRNISLTDGRDAYWSTGRAPPVPSLLITPSSQSTTRWESLPSSSPPHPSRLPGGTLPSSPPPHPSRLPSTMSQLTSHHPINRQLLTNLFNSDSGALFLSRPNLVTRQMKIS